jgi:hypothetical protein
MSENTITSPSSECSKTPGSVGQPISCEPCPRGEFECSRTCPPCEACRRRGCADSYVYKRSGYRIDPHARCSAFMNATIGTSTSTPFRSRKILPQIKPRPSAPIHIIQPFHILHIFVPPGLKQTWIIDSDDSIRIRDRIIFQRLA